MLSNKISVSSLGIFDLFGLKNCNRDEEETATWALLVYPSFERLIMGSWGYLVVGSGNGNWQRCKLSGIQR